MGCISLNLLSEDMINSYNLLNLGGILVIDDIVPESLVYSQRIRLAPKWSGDVYKALYIWKKCFDINITIVDCQPSCLAVIKKTISTPLKVPAISHQYLDDSSEWDKRMLSLKRHFPTVAFENSFVILIPHYKCHLLRILLQMHLF